MYDLLRLIFQIGATCAMDSASADAFVIKRKRLHLLERVHISSIENRWKAHELRHPAKVRISEFAPFCNERERISAFEGIILIAGEINRIAQQLTNIR